jgi:hypothetical protein
MKTEPMTLQHLWDILRERAEELRCSQARESELVDMLQRANADRQRLVTLSDARASDLMAAAERIAALEAGAALGRAVRELLRQLGDPRLILYRRLDEPVCRPCRDWLRARLLGLAAAPTPEAALPLAAREGEEV